MKEEAPNKKLPPKMSGGCASTSSTPTKTANDEILSSLLRINNFDSISSIKDESLDIDLSACVTITADSAMMINGNSLSTTDFWRVLDENAQNSQLDITLSSDESTILRNEPITDSQELSTTGGLLLSSSTGKSSSPCDFTTEEISIKKELAPNSFSGTFLRPELPPPSAGITFSPLKKMIKPTAGMGNKTPPPKRQARKQTQQARKTKLPTASNSYLSGESKKSKAIHYIKEEPPEQLLIDALDNAATSPIAQSHTENAVSASKMNTSPPKFKIFMRSIANDCNEGVNNNNSNETVENNENGEATGTTITKSESRMGDVGTTGTDASEANNKTTNTTISEKLYKCVDCSGMLLQGTEERSTHELAGHHVLFKCNICVRDFEQEAGLKKHLKTHRTIETRKDVWKKCPDCGKCLKLGSMWMHRKIHSENKKYGCDICGQKFVQKINLTHHSRVHTAEKPYECSECQKRFQERSHLYRHQKYHAQTRSYRCDKCGKMYKTERCLKVHNLVHLEQRPFACTVCDKSFISNSKLKQHSNIHTGERPFKCNYCPRDFTNFPNWLKHTRRRHKVDHKTGEQLENIPSYCSKKSNKAVQPKKAAVNVADATKATTATTTTIGENLLNTNTQLVTVTTKTTTTTTNNNKPVHVNTLTTSAATTTAATVLTTISSSQTKPTNVTTNTLLTTTTTSATETKSATTATKIPVKRQKKKVNVATSAELTVHNNNKYNDLVGKKTIPIKNVDNLLNDTPNGLIITTTAITGTTSGKTISTQSATATKIKRERKQATPKQVQKSMNPQGTTSTALITEGVETTKTTIPLQFALPNKLTTASTVSLIKREIVESTKPLSQMSEHFLDKSSSMLNSFNDLHCLSITSAEELIMEQALEMEESGLFDGKCNNTNAPLDITDTDNAVSATETAAALHFKVKHEIESDVDALGNIKQEEFISLKDSHKRVLCSSLESSPYSSPASIELCSVATPTMATSNDMCTINNHLNTNSPIYFMPGNFPLNHSALPANLALITNSNDLNNQHINNNNNMEHHPQQQQQQHQHQVITVPASVLINQLYMPTLSGSSMLVPLQNNQMLPSVDTLLFSAAAATAAASRGTSTVTTTTTASPSRFHRIRGVAPQNRT